MRRPIQLRQIEAFKAVVESGTVSQAANIMHVTQPAVSKLLAHLEEDTQLELFERVRGRLVPSAAGMKLYRHIDRIFASLKQVEHAVDLIKREEQERIVVGVLPALSGMFISNATRRFLAGNEEAHVSLIGRASQFVIEWLLSNQLDVGIVNGGVDHPLIEALPLGPGHLACILPRNHPLASKDQITAGDLDGTPFIRFSNENRIRQKIEQVLLQQGVRPRFVLEATLATTVCELVADGLGITVMDPLLAYGQKQRLDIRPFVPIIKSDLRICRLQNAHASSLTDSFVRAVQHTAKDMFGGADRRE
ncbi:LysR family transcriptional regulator [Agrobacterium sp. AGB01]|uniref:LysR substrate-binding domain-containing protein n=1 Tax=Agrobacterium sp. AGB01 TaxID=2769302 RepID=UPI001780644D|nr:LysR substrate-binding domain-containing protein [Agrobacterium sp. AGB01]MBD9388443.1 LysR family transcriptional regulator [Agrobacterium sp. AGB01]